MGGGVAPRTRRHRGGAGRGRGSRRGFATAVSITTGHGDAGETGLLYGGRVPKDDLHTEAYGSLDEAISALGLARGMGEDRERADYLQELQRELFVVGAELATGVGHHELLEKHFDVVKASMVERLDQK